MQGKTKLTTEEKQALCQILSPLQIYVIFFPLPNTLWYNIRFQIDVLVWLVAGSTR